MGAGAFGGGVILEEIDFLPKGAVCNGFPIYLAQNGNVIFCHLIVMQ